MARVLAVGDIHAPFDHPNYLRFLKEVQDLYGTDETVFIGDLVDQHAISTFRKESEAASPRDEWRMALTKLHFYYTAFPEAKWVEGNHDNRAIKRATEVHIPNEWIKSLPKIYEVPRWTLGNQFEIDGVKYVHGEGAGGISSWQNFAIKMGQSVVFGHLHSIHGVRYHRTPKSQIFTAATGCGVDETAYAFRYAKFEPRRPVLGCVVVIDGAQAIPVVMDMGDRRNYRIRKKQ